MRLVIQRVSKASVKVNSEIVGEIDKGILVLVGISRDYNDEKLQWMTNKVLNMRIWESDRKGFDLSVKDIQGEILVVSQFTLHGYMDGNKPNFKNSAEYDKAKEIYEIFIEELKKSDLKVQTGEFGAMMEVELVNDGPVTLILDK